MGPSLKAKKSNRSFQRDGEIRVNFQQAPMWWDTSRGLERDRALQEGWKLVKLYQKVGAMMGLYQMVGAGTKRFKKVGKLIGPYQKVGAGTKRFQKVGKLMGLYHRVGAGMRRF